jgi:3-oxosteroid 1-dehydrogenase
VGIEREEAFDFIIVGSGGGSVPAALMMKDHGKSVVIIEKEPHYGGTSAFSGGVIWIPNNDHLNAEGGNDSPERARTYFDEMIGDVGPASSPARRTAFIREGAQMIRFLESKGMKFIHAHWPDYYDNRPGGIAQGRSLAAPLFNVNELGEWAPKLARHPFTSRMPIGSPEAVTLFTAKKTWRGKVLLAKIALRVLRNKLLGKDFRGAGNALQGRLYQIAFREGIPVWTDTPVKDFLIEDRQVTGVLAEQNGQTIQVKARLGVLINAGGFSRNLEMRERYQPKPTSVNWTYVSPGNTGEMIQAAMRLGAAVDLMDDAFWQAGSYMPEDWTCMGMHSPNDIGKPHCIVVDAQGKRFANEASSYMEFGHRMYAAGAVPAWAIFDTIHRNTYIWGMLAPGVTPKALIERGYLKKADSLEAIARACSIDPAGLAQTVARFNVFAQKGVDEDFHRGEGAYNRYSGDPTVKPNVCLGTIERAPFYAVALYPGDVGTCGGILTDEHARALRPDGSVISGLYATGISSATVMGHCYLGAGASVGPSMVFGYIAARHAAGLNG